MRDHLKIGFIFFAGVFLSSVPFLPATTTSKDGVTISATTTIDGQAGGSLDGVAIGGETFLSKWNGDHVSGASYLEYNSGASAKTTTANTNVTFSTTDIQYSGGNNYAYWTNSANDIFDDAAGTLYFTLAWTDDADTDLEHGTIFEIPDTVFTDTYYMYVWVDGTANQLKADWNDGTNIFTHNNTTTLLVANTYRVGVAWDTVGDTFSISVVASGAPSWQDDAAIALVEWPTDPVAVKVGEHYKAYQSADIIKLSDIYILSGYKDADPLQ